MGKKKRGTKQKPEAHYPEALRSVKIESMTPEDAIFAGDDDDEYDRIFKILGVEDADDEDNAAVDHENLKKYMTYLEKELKLPLIVTGIEDLGCFGWEEYYNLGPGSKKEYEKLKKKYPSFRDEYEFLGFDEDFDEEEGLYVNVKRLSDKKNFKLTLADLEAVDKNSKNAQLLNDHAVWYTNFR